MGYEVFTNIMPQDIQRALNSPGEMQSEFLDFLQEAGYNIDQSKSIAAVNYYGQQVTSGVDSRFEFFNQRQAGATKFAQNTPDVRPESEHAMLWAIQILTLDALGTELLAGWDAFSLGNGLLTVEVNNVVYLDEYSISDLTRDAQPNSGVILLPEPIIWPGQTNMKAVIETSVNPAADATIEVHAFGLGLV